MREQLLRGLIALGISNPEAGAQTLAHYGSLLLEQNKVMNLTAITEPSQVVSLHFMDSAALLGIADFRGKSVVDVGTGAGLPGLPLRILEPTLSLTLLDSLAKRVHWLQTVCDTLGLEGVSCVHGRAEELSLTPTYRDCFDIATSRAVAPLRLLCELCLPLVAPGGVFLAMKSTECEQEVVDAADAIALLGGALLPIADYTVEGTDIMHRVIPIQKRSPTPPGYPRRWARMQKAPL